MAIKESLKNVAADLQWPQTYMQETNIPRWSQLYQDIGNYQGSNIQPYTDQFKGMVMDENKRGYSPETVNNMRGNATGSIAGAMKSAAMNTNRAIAASGMGNTGLGINAAKQRGYETAKQMRTANRDVDLAQAEAKRQDLWNAAQQWQQGINMGQNLFNQRMNAASGEAQANQILAQITGSKVAPLMGAHDVSFWGDFGDITGALGNLWGPAGGVTLGF